MTTLAYSGSPYGVSIRRYRRIGLLLIGLFGARFIAWCTLAPLSSAVIASTNRRELKGLARFT